MGALFNAVSSEIHAVCDEVLATGHMSDAQMRAIDLWEKECRAGGIVDKSLIRKMKQIARRGLSNKIVFDDEE